MDVSLWVYKDDMEKEMRFKIFKDNLAYIEAFNNARNQGYKLSVNGFADQTNEVFKAIRNRFKFPSEPALRETTPFGGVDQGCGGGYMNGGFAFIAKNKGINTEAAYPYEAEDATCNTIEESIHAAKITGHEDVPAEYDFQLYSGGVFNGYCGFMLTHGVTAVGYGTSDDGIKYWLVKNSWGTCWVE
ncbi:hypothetical protein Tco_1088595 [Tanacetum coccineum]